MTGVQTCALPIYVVPFSSYLTLNNCNLEKSLKVIKTGTIRKLECGFLFAFHGKYGSTLHHLPYKMRYWSKIVIISYPFHSAPPLGGHHRNIAFSFGVENLEWWGYPTVKKLYMYNRLDSIPACDRRTDRQTDRRTSCDDIVRVMHTRRAVTKCVTYSIPFII